MAAALPLKVRLLRLTARGLIAGERLWRGLWPGQAFVAVYAALAFSGVLADVAWYVRLCVLFAACAGLAWGIFRLAGAYRLPSMAEAERRLEQDGDVPHRPFQALADTPSIPAPRGDAAWAAHMARMGRALGRVQLGAPRISLTGRDPWALRHAALLLLIGGLVLGWGDLGPRLSQAAQVWPVSAPRISAVELWIDPPAYTGAAPIRATDVLAEIVVPAGSVLKAVVETGKGAPTLLVGDEALTFTPIGSESGSDGAFAVDTELVSGDMVTVLEADGVILAEWPLTIVPDAPPTASFVDVPAISNGGIIRFTYKVADDYGVGYGRIGFEPVDGEPAGGYHAAESFAVPLPANVKKASGALFRDLTAHRWAGRTVALTLKVEDGVGQTGQSKTLNFPLPERVFQHPVAIAIIAARHELDAEPRKREPIAETMRRLMRAPRAYGESTAVMTALALLRARLLIDRTERSYTLARELMWEVALRLEDGDLSSAERALRKAREALAEALARGAPPEEISRLVEELKRAVERMLQALARAQENAQAQQQPMNQNSRLLQGQDLMRMLDRIRELSQAGANDAAREALSQVDRMLEQLANARMVSPDMKRMQQMLQGMQEAQALADQQRRLMDETLRSKPGQRSQPGQQGQGQQGQQGQGRQGQRGQGQQGQGGGFGQSDQALAGRQEALRRALGEIMRQLGEDGDIPGGLGGAERAMRNAVDGLRYGDQQGALGAQGQALEQLQQAARSMAEQLARQFGQQPGQQGGGEGRAGQGGTDPLGRATRGKSAGGVELPDIGDLQRARAIQDELRRRAGDRARPPVELDYLERLLKRF